MNIGTFAQAREEFMKGTIPSYCDLTIKSPDGDGTFKPKCVATDMGRVASSNSKESTIISYMKETAYRVTDCKNCTEVNNSCERLSDDYCRTKESFDFAMVGVENLNYTFSHKIISFLIIIIYTILNKYSPNYKDDCIIRWIRRY